MSRNLSANGLNLIKSFEGCKLTAYKCFPTEKYYTIGYGHYGSDVKAGMKITEEQAEELLLQDCGKAIKNVNSFMGTYNFNQNQFDALVSFAFNIGSINQLTDNGTRTIEQISSKITAYNKSGGKVIEGLVKRRAKEKELFDTPSSTTKKSNEEIAKEVVAGKWGNGNERKTALTNAGYDYTTIQSIVNTLASTEVKKSNEEIAKEVVAGKWGNGNERKTALTKAGYDYNTIQPLVNKLLKG